MNINYLIYRNPKDFAQEDLEDMLVDIESLFHIRFQESELAYVSTFGEMFDHIVNKINLEDSESCTTQQAFYKLRTEIANLAPGIEISPQTLIENILPRKGRILKVEQLEERLGVKLNLLRSTDLVYTMNAVILFISLVAIFFNGEIAVLGFIIFLLGNRIANLTAKELSCKTVGDLATRMTRDNYLKSRRNPGTVNKREIKEVLAQWFGEQLALEESERLIPA